VIQVLEVGFSLDQRIGSYRVEAELGSTSWGTLLQARHAVLPRRAIIKVVQSEFAAMQPYALQTLREACIIEVIAHPGVPIVYESGVLGDRRPWFAFEWVAGSTLEELLAHGAMPAIEVAGLLRDLTDILEHAHRRGVIHCGLRPDRVVITTERRYPLCIPDWSEAIAHDATTHLPWAAGEGSRRYRAPELAHHVDGNCKGIDDRADLFALGVIAYRALTGGLPFALDHDAARFVPAHELRPDAPAALTAIIDAMLAFDRFDRPSASEVRDDVDALLEALPELSPRADHRREPRLAIVRDPQDHARNPREDAAGLPAGAGGLVQDQEVVLLDQPRLRRPRWTPDVSYVETAPVEIKLVEDDRAK
jgi:serine/threonine-protein kinase